MLEVSSGRYDNTAAGAIEVISPPSSPVQSQQDKPEDGQQQAPGTNANQCLLVFVLFFKSGDESSLFQYQS